MEPGFYQGDKTPVLQNLIRDAALSSRSRLSLQVHKLLKKRIGCRDYTGVRLESTLCGNHLRKLGGEIHVCLLYTSPSPRDRQKSRMPSSA